MLRIIMLIVLMITLTHQGVRAQYLGADGIMRSAPEKAEGEELPWLKDAPPKKRKMGFPATKKQPEKAPEKSGDAPQKSLEPEVPKRPAVRLPADDMPEMHPLPPVPKQDAPVLPQAAAQGTKPVYIQSVTFGRDDAAIDEAQQAQFQSVMDISGKREQARLVLKSYASQRDGHVSEPRRIALKRAVAARQYLVGKGFSQERITLQPIGLEEAVEQESETLEAQLAQEARRARQVAAGSATEPAIDRIDIYVLR